MKYIKREDKKIEKIFKKEIELKAIITEEETKERLSKIDFKIEDAKKALKRLEGKKAELENDLKEIKKLNG